MSLKRSFRCDEFDDVKKDLEEILKGCGKIDCGALHPVRISDMLWLCPERDEKLKMIHEEIDLFLSDKYQIPIDGYDMVYQPHVTVFRDEDDGKLDEMYRRLSILEPVNAAIDEVILSQGERSHRFGL